MAMLNMTTYVRGVVNNKTLVATAPVTNPEPCTSTVHDDVATTHQYSSRVHLRIIVITYDRADSLAKTLQSLQVLELDGHQGAVEVWLDRGKSGKIDQKTLDVAEKFCWKHGPVTVHVHVKHQGLVGEYKT